MSLKVEEWPIDRLVPYARNPRKNDAVVAKMVSAIREFGFRIPIVAKSDGSIVDGHLRYKAAQEMGLQTVPVALADELTETQVKAFRLLANRSANWAEWDDDLLKLELEELRAEDFPIEMIGFEPEEVSFSESSFHGKTDPDEAPAVETKTISRNHDIWICGKHRVMCGDSTNTEDMQALMVGEFADLWLTDPPYNVSYTGKTKDALTIQNDSLEDQKFLSFLCEAYKTASHVMRTGAAFYIWHADLEGYNFRSAAQNTELRVRQCLIWVKNSLVLGRQDYQWQHEPCLYGWKDGAAHFWGADRKQATTLFFDRPTKNLEHPTMKPVALFEYLLLNSTREDEVVLDSFGGSGTSLIAATKNNRRARIMELSEAYCDVIVRRWQNFTGEKAFRESDGVEFSSLDAEK